MNKLLVMLLLGWSIISPSLFGAGRTEKLFDMQRFIDQELKAGKNKIVIPPGQYRVKPVDGHHLRFSNLSNIVIIADGVEMICTETTRAITFEKCNNVTLRGLTVDYDPLPFTQGRIVAMAPDKSWLEIELSGGYPLNPDNKKVEIFDAKTRALKVATHFDWKPFQALGNRRYRLVKGDKYLFNPQNDLEEIGDIVAANSMDASSGRTSHAIYSDYGKNLKLENITLYSGNCFGFLKPMEKETFITAVR